MKFICSKAKFELECGKLLSEAIHTFTNVYPFLTISDDNVYFNLNLQEIFTEPIDLFSVHSSLVEDCFILTTLFGDENINPELLFIMVDLIQDVFESDPIRDDGAFCLTFTEISEWYGEDFDSNMNQLFPNDYTAFKDYLLD